MIPCKCYLQSVGDSKKRIQLPHDKIVFIGRNEESGITDLKVSRNHLKCVANVSSNSVSIELVGQGHSGCNGYALLKEETYVLKSGDIVEILLGSHQYEVIFDSGDQGFDLKRHLSQEDAKSMRKKQKSGKDIMCLEYKWDEHCDKKLFSYLSATLIPKAKIAGFDLDGTIVKTKSGLSSPKSKDDWEWKFKNIPEKLGKLCEDDYRIVVFSNQGVLETELLKARIELIMKALKAPIYVFIATGATTIYQKPAPGMWRHFLQTCNGNLAINYEHSFYVGSNAGREKSSISGDHSKADRLFALNIGLKFHTPEEFFQNAKPSHHKPPLFNPMEHVKFGQRYPAIPAHKGDLAIMVGAPASGKTFFCKEQLVPKGYVCIGYDELQAWQKCSKKLLEHLKRRRSVVVDDSHPSKESREKLIELARKNNVFCRCFLMTTSKMHARHNAVFREITTKNPIGDIRLNLHFKHYQEPSLSEGFSEIININFVPFFDNKEEEILYKMFLLKD